MRLADANKVFLKFEGTAQVISASMALDLDLISKSNLDPRFWIMLNMCLLHKQTWYESSTFAYEIELNWNRTYNRKHS